MKRLLLFTLLALIFLTETAYAQYVGIGEATPGSKVDVVHTGLTGNSLEISHNGATNGSSSVWVKNSGIGRAFNVQMLNTGNNLPAVQVTQLGLGANSRGIEVSMDAANPAMGVGVFHDGTGIGQFTSLSLVTNSQPGMRVDHAGIGHGIVVNAAGAGWGTYNNITGTGGGLYNRMNNNGIGSVDDVSTAGGIGNAAIFSGAAGAGFVVDTIGGDGFAYFSIVRTATPTSGSTVSGANFGGNQYGVGHGILINHYGTAGRNAEFNIENAANTDPSIFTINRGQGAAIIGQNQNNAITGVLTVADFSYTGTDIADHIGVEGSSTPAAGWGIGVQGTGNYYGVHGVGGTFGLFATGNSGATGTKSFLIDHPQDPENKYLRHFSVESNEVLNMYRGIVMLDANGKATVQLPDYFETININYSYQLTPIGTPQQPWVVKEIANNQFEVGGAANTKVSWTVHAQRNDPYVQQHKNELQDVSLKGVKGKGKYLMPELYGQSAEKGMNYREPTVAEPTPTKMKSGAIKAQLEQHKKLSQKGKNLKPVKMADQEEETSAK